MRRAISLGVILLITVLAAIVTVQAADHAFVGVEKCRTCHKTQYNSWLETAHAKATEAAKASTERPFGPDCLQCHATDTDEALAGVQCEMCHGPGADYKGMSVMKDQAAAIEAGLVIPIQTVCSRCHDGQDHHTAVVMADQLQNKTAIHEFKNPPQ